MSSQPPPSYVQPARSSTMAIISLVAGIVGFFMLPFIGSLVAVITGHMAKREIRESNGTLSGDGLATAGLILGYVGLGFVVLGICLFVLWFVFVAGLVFTTQSSSYLAPLLFA